MAGVSSSVATFHAAIRAPATPEPAPEDAQELRHHVKGGPGFRNPWDSFIDRSGPQIMGALLWRKITGNMTSPDTTPPTVTVHKPTFLPTRKTQALRATWLGHACYYVEFPGGFRALFDPVFTPRCSPFSFLGPKRYTDVPCQIDDIPFIDAVIISHNHYDHLSHPTILKIQEKYPNVHFFAPLGNKAWFTKCGVHNMTELDWWQQREMHLTPTPATATSSTGTSTSSRPSEKPTSTPTPPAGQSTHNSSPSLSSTDDPSAMTATISCLPCQHMSARTPFDKSHTLWSSWSVASGGKKVYFGGDTGYRAVPPSVPESAATSYTPDVHGPLPHCPAFAQIGALRGPFDLGLIPIGAYKPRFVMSPMHANPFDAVNIFVDTRCRRAMGIHWGTWVLTEEDVLEPPKLLKDALRSKDLPETGTFDVCDIGESREFV